MKRLNKSALSVLVMACVAAMSLTACSKAGGDPAKLIGKDAQMVIIAPSLGKTLGNISGFIDWIATKSPMAGAAKQQLSLVVGFDIFNNKELEKRGLHPDGGLAIVLDTVESQQAYFILSVKDKKAFVEFLNETFKKQGMPELKEDDGYYSGMFGTMTFKKGFALIGQNKSILESVGEGDSLKDSESYEMAVDNIGDDHDIILYMSPEMIKASAKMGLAEAPEAKALENIINLYGAMGMGLTLSGSDIEAKSFVQVNDMSAINKIMTSGGGSDMLSKMPGNAALLARAQINFPELWAFVKSIAEKDPSAGSDITQGISQINKGLGMDVETDVIANIAGDPVIAFYGMTGKRNDSPDFLAALTLKDESKISAALDKFVELGMFKKTKNKALKDTGAVEFRVDRSTTLYIAVSSGNLIIASSANRMKTILEGSVGDSAIATIPHADAKQLLEDKTKNVFYINVAQMVEAIKSSMRKSKARELDSNLSLIGGVGDAYMLMHADGNEAGFTGTLKLHMGQ